MSQAIRPRQVDPHALKLLIHRTGSLGDTLIAIPSLRLIAAAFPNAQRLLLCNEPQSSLAAPAMSVLEGLGLVHGALTYKSSNTPETARAIWGAVRATAPDVVISLSAKHGAITALRDWLMFKAAGVKRVIGLGLTQRALRKRTSAPSHEREAQRVARTIRALGTIDWSDKASWVFEPSTDDRERVARKIGGWRWQPGYFCVALGTKAPSNDWGQDRWLELIGQLSSAAPIRLICIGAAEDQVRSAELLKQWPHSGENLCGRLSVRETAAVLAGAQLLIAHDSGPMHLAAAVGTKIVAVFSRRNRMGQWFPLGEDHQILYSEVECAGCGLTHCTLRQNLCTRQIAAVEVAARSIAVLSGGAHPVI